jgi:hypothetical protein
VLIEEHARGGDLVALVERVGEHRRDDRARGSVEASRPRQALELRSAHLLRVASSPRVRWIMAACPSE